VNASIAAFELKNSDGQPVVGSDGRPYGGRIRSDVLNYGRNPDRGSFNLVGGAQSSNYDNLGVFDGAWHGYKYKGKWDARYDNGQSPPFYPGYVVESGGPTGETYGAGADELSNGRFIETDLLRHSQHESVGCRI
jgi:hypothetical protein